MNSKIDQSAAFDILDAVATWSPKISTNFANLTLKNSFFGIDGQLLITELMPLALGDTVLIFDLQNLVTTCQVQRVKAEKPWRGKTTNSIIE